MWLKYGILTSSSSGNGSIAAALEDMGEETGYEVAFFADKGQALTDALAAQLVDAEAVVVYQGDTASCVGFYGC